MNNIPPSIRQIVEPVARLQTFVEINRDKRGYFLFEMVKTLAPPYGKDGTAALIRLSKDFDWHSYMYGNAVCGYDGFTNELVVLNTYKYMLEETRKGLVIHSSIEYNLVGAVLKYEKNPGVYIDLIIPEHSKFHQFDKIFSFGGRQIGKTASFADRMKFYGGMKSIDGVRQLKGWTGPWSYQPAVMKSYPLSMAMGIRLAVNTCY